MVTYTEDDEPVFWLFNAMSGTYIGFTEYDLANGTQSYPPIGVHGSSDPLDPDYMALNGLKAEYGSTDPGDGEGGGTDPTDPTDPTGPTDPTDPTNPTDPEDPGDGDGGDDSGTENPGGGNGGQSGGSDNAGGFPVDFMGLAQKSVTVLGVVLASIFGVVKSISIAKACIGYICGAFLGKF